MDLYQRPESPSSSALDTVTVPLVQSPTELSTTAVTNPALRAFVLASRHESSRAPPIRTSDTETVVTYAESLLSMGPARYLIAGGAPGAGSSFASKLPTMTLAESISRTQTPVGSAAAAAAVAAGGAGVGSNAASRRGSYSTDITPVHQDGLSASPSASSLALPAERRLTASSSSIAAAAVAAVAAAVLGSAESLSSSAAAAAASQRPHRGSALVRGTAGRDLSRPLTATLRGRDARMQHHLAEIDGDHSGRGGLTRAHARDARMILLDLKQAEHKCMSIVHGALPPGPYHQLRQFLSAFLDEVSVHFVTVEHMGEALDAAIAAAERHKTERLRAEQAARELLLDNARVRSAIVYLQEALRRERADAETVREHYLDSLSSAREALASRGIEAAAVMNDFVGWNAEFELKRGAAGVGAHGDLRRARKTLAAGAQKLMGAVGMLESTAAARVDRLNKRIMASVARLQIAHVALSRLKFRLRRQTQVFDLFR